MHERMSIACNEEKHQKKKDKEGEEKAKDTNSDQKVAFASSFAQIADRKNVCWVYGGNHLANACPHCDKILLRSGIRIPWRRIIQISRMLSIIS